ncbi:hypothetical protein [Neorhizobium sp. NCHU2750]|uniref:hypothetical protein n=1 Tax=Neorhizobium sp. NCHU2750 TaxID=1825976 RepID=UPI000E7169D4|nr:hypothetical protein NCHU2750_28400 [Neorhizobium sp. NCHU2750]
MTKSKFLATAEINGKPVSFFTPPHDEPDFLWVDIEELAGAFLPEADAKRMVQHAQNLFPGQRSVATATNGDRIATIACHSMAQGFCGFIDHLNGHNVEEDGAMHGPAHIAYCFASADMEIEHRPKSFEEIFAAFKNNGGPFMRGLRE